LVLLASFISDFWNHQLVEHGRQYVFLVFAGFLVSFAVVRLSTRLMRSPAVPWWPGSVVSDSGVHVHHLVFGIFTMMGSGVVSFALHDVGFWYELAAFAFGVGIGLTIDEFALWLYLDDVYWSREGRSSIDATLIAFAVIGLMVLGIAPFEVDTNSIGDLVATIVGTILLVSALVVCFLKRRMVAGVTGLFFLPFALYGACRIGKPDSWWAKRFYGLRNPAKQSKSESRFRADRRSERLKHRMIDLIGGEPEDEYNARIAARSAGKQPSATDPPPR
jgi:hypothetical protein